MSWKDRKKKNQICRFHFRIRWVQSGETIHIRSTWKSHTHTQNRYPNLISVYFACTFIKRGSIRMKAGKGGQEKRKTNFLRRSDVFESNKAISRVNCNTYLRKPKSFHKSVKKNFLTNLFQYDAHGTFWNRCWGCLFFFFALSPFYKYVCSLFLEQV